MNYFEASAAITRRRIDLAIDAFFQRPDFDPTAPFVVLLPGGLGSRLRRARHAFDVNAPELDPQLSTVWVDCGLFVNQDARKLFIDDTLLDTGQRIIVADGEIDFVVNPYEDAIRGFRSLGFQVLLVGWDWRRHVPLAVDLLRYALEQLDGRMLAAGHASPLGQTFLVGHSMGGMVAKLLLTEFPDLAEELPGMISVGTPFYGYYGQLTRIYEGAKYFNELYGADVVAQVTSSMPGLYSLMPIDQATFATAGPDIGLSDYPVTDLGTGAPVDPYAVTTQARYPKWARIEQFTPGLELRHRLAAPLPDKIATRVHHIRGNDPHSTISTARWDANIPANYDPATSRSPLHVDDGPGDHTIPLWSARLAQTPDERVHDFANAEHTFLMEDRRIIAKIAEIIDGVPRGPADFEDFLGSTPRIASNAETVALFQAQRRGDAPVPEIFRGPDRIELLGMPVAVVRRIMQETAM